VLDGIIGEDIEEWVNMGKWKRITGSKRGRRNKGEGIKYHKKRKGSRGEREKAPGKRELIDKMGSR